MVLSAVTIYREDRLTLMCMKPTLASTENSVRVELFTDPADYSISYENKIVPACLSEFGFEVVVRDVGSDAQALADLCWLDGTLKELPFVVIWQGGSIVDRFGRREVHRSMTPRLRKLRESGILPPD